MNVVRFEGVITSCCLALVAAVWAPIAGAQSDAGGQASPLAPEGFDVRAEDVERGILETVEYDSSVVCGKRPAVIYTPAGYSSDPVTRNWRSIRRWRCLGGDIERIWRASERT